MNFRLLFFLLFLNYSSFSQELISGQIIGSKTNQPLAFATLVFNHDHSMTALSDIDGRFSFRSQVPIQSLTVRYLGYETKTFVNFTESPLVLKLEPALNELEEVVIFSGNPADQIMRKVLANKARNNPENIGSFRYRSYNKTTFDSPNKDSLELFQNSHFFMMESVSERTYKKPGLSEEIVLGTKISGFENPKFAALATEFQPFSFYGDIVKLYNVKYLNPISNGSLKKYEFQLKDTLFQATDSVFVIAFEPLPGKNFQGLKGALFINSNQYAVQNVIAFPAEKGKINIRIQQQYQFVDDKHWFPEQLNYQLIFEGTKKEGDELIVEGKSYIDQVQFNLEVERADFSMQSVHLMEDAGKKNVGFWENYRRKPLDSVEMKTYRVLDSLGKKYHFDSYLKVMSGILNNRIPIGFVDLDLSKSFIYNDYEGFRLGTGFYTNEKVFEKISVGGFFGYGLKDHEWKYGGEIKYKPSNRFSVTGGYANDLMETGKYTADLENIFASRRYIASRFDHTEHYFLKFKFSPFRYLSTKIDFRQGKTIPKYAYEFWENGNFFTEYQHSSIGMDLRFAYGEKQVDILGKIAKLKSEKYPIVSVSYIRGLKGVFKSDFEYNKIELGIEQTFYTRGLGLSRYKLEGGFVDHSIPYGLLFTGKGSLDDDFPVIMDDHFQTMYPYEFLSDRKINLFLSHDFGTLLFKLKKFQPRIVLHQNMGWGNLSQSENHRFMDFKTMEEIYLESGIQFDNLLKINYMNIGYLGFGVAGFYRYGFYSLPEFDDNLVIKATLGFTIK